MDGDQLEFGEPVEVAVVPRGGRRGRLRVRRGGSTRRVRVRGGTRGGSVTGLAEPHVAVPRGGCGTGRGQGVRGRRGRGSDRPGSRTIQELNIQEIEDLPAGQVLESSLHPQRKRQWVPPAPLPVPPPPRPAVTDAVPTPSPSTPPPQVAQGDHARSPSPPASPAFFVECESSAPSMDRPCQSLRDNDIYHQLCYGSEPDSGDSEDDDVAPFISIPRAQRSVWETPLDIEDADDQPAADPAPAAAPADAIEDAPLSATDQPWGLYEFDWKPFPNVPIPPESRREMFSHSDVGPTAPCIDPYDIFIGIWDRQFMEYIASETNRYAQQVAASMIETNSLHPNSGINKWRDTNADELYVYFAIIIGMRVVVKSRIEEYWNATPDIFYTPGFSAHMSGFRFTMLSKCLHFVNNQAMCALELDASEAKLFKVQPLLSHLNNKFQTMYRLGQNIVLDESLLMWKGWLDINQLIPNKAATVGIKTYEICESQTGYLWRFEVHALGKSQRSQPQQFEDPMKASTPAIVLRLTHGLEGKGHTLWMDNFYNSPCLARRLKGLGFDCVGTLRTNRKFVPQALHSLTEGNMRQGQITGLTSGDVDVMVWRDNNRVAMISTYHGNGVSQGRDSTKPILIHDYNIMMGGVDKKDQMLAMYPIELKRTKVWYKKLFRRLLNVSILNSYIIHKKTFSSSSSSSSLTHRHFRIALVKSLLAKHSPSFLPAPTQTLHQNTRYDLRFHQLAELPFGSNNQAQRRRRKCAREACGKLVHTYCIGCSKTMCMTPCFLTLHS